jgi:hypothetical protein
MLSVMSVATLFFVLALPLDLLVQLGVGFVVLVALTAPVGYALYAYSARRFDSYRLD